jgi:acyl-CoA synthetase (AMP-forming)/AMP-acid ligase II
MFEDLAAEIARLGQLYGDRVAVTTDASTTSFAQLHEHSRRVADAIASSTTPGARVAILDKNSVEILEMFFGAAISGRVLVMLNWRLADDELAEVLDHARPELVVVSPELEGLLDASLARAVTEPAVVAIGPAYEAWRTAAPATTHPPVSSPDVVLSQMYTSGTSGRPKGVLGTHRSIGGGLKSGDPCGYDDTTVLMCSMPMFHIGGMQPALIALVRGGRVVIRRDVDPHDLLATIERERVTHGFLVPTVISMVVDAARTASYDLSSVRGITYGASPITPAALRRAVSVFGRNLIQVYGSTETCGGISQLDPEDHHDDGPRQHLLQSAGRPYDWVEVKIVDVETGAVVPTGSYGEVLIRSEQNCIGYADDPQSTAEAIDADGWLHTGDGGHLDADGYLFLTDRVKDMIISGGENVFPIEVESVIAELDGVDGVAVVGTPDPHWGERVVAVLTVRADTQLSSTEVISHCKTRLAGYKCPKEVVFVDSLPKTPSGKILKREIRTTLGSSRTGSANS